MIVPALLLACAGGPPAPLTVVVSLDTLRADRLGVLGNPDGLTPNLDRLAAEGVAFRRAYAAANETRYSHANLFTSRWASELAPLDEAFTVPGTVPTLAFVLSTYGWQTAGFVGGGQLARGFGLEQGFGTWDDSAAWGSVRDTVPKALRWLDGPSDAPRFLFVHGYDTHDRYLKPTPFGYARADRDYAGAARDAIRGQGRTSLVTDGWLPARIAAVELHARSQPRPGRAPYAPTDPADAPLGEADRAQIRGVYDAATAYADAWVGRLLAGLEARGLYEDATIVVLSDHGEELGEHGVFHHRYALAEETVHVPLLVRLPGGAHGGRAIDDLVELSDVLPTLLDLAGVPPPAEARGTSLVGVLNGAAPHPRALAHAEGAMRLLSVSDGEARLTAAGLSADNPALADLLAATPTNAATLRIDGDARHAEALRAALVEWRRAVRVGGRSTPSAAAVEAARAHGYWGTGP